MEITKLLLLICSVTLFIIIIIAIVGLFKGRKHKKKSVSQKKKLTLADLEGMSDAELADLYYEEYGDEEFDIPDFDDE